MAKIFVLVDGYLPGYKWGGPIRSIANMVEQLGDLFSFSILTRDRDQMEPAPYPGVAINSWSRVGKADVYYASPEALSFSTIRRLICEVGPDIIYVNNFFPHDWLEDTVPSFHLKLLLLRRLRLLPRTPVILAPRGCFSPGALAIKGWQKRAFIALARASGLFDNLLWHASFPLEAEELRRGWGKPMRVIDAPNMLAAPRPRCEAQLLEKQPGTLRLIFFSRITPKKNLAAAITLLGQLEGDVALDIYGIRETTAYWQECEQAIAALPANVHVTYQGVAPHSELPSILGRYHFFLFPTRGENFGHVIFEALAAGCPVLISDQTPWDGLEEKGAGWDIPLDDAPRWRAALQGCLSMDAKAHRQMRAAAFDFALHWASSNDILRRNILLFQEALPPAKRTPLANEILASCVETHL